MKWASGFASPMPPNEREILDDTFFDSDELALLMRAYRRAIAEAPQLDEVADWLSCASSLIWAKKAFAMKTHWCVARSEVLIRKRLSEQLSAEASGLLSWLPNVCDSKWTFFALSTRRSNCEETGLHKHAGKAFSGVRNDG